MKFSKLISIFVVSLIAFVGASRAEEATETKAADAPAAAAPKAEAPKAKGKAKADKKSKKNPVETTSEGLIKEDIKVGTGKVAKAGQMVSVHYVGTLTDGKKFDSSRDRGQPFEFLLGGKQVIRGWDEGVAGMKEKGIRKLTIPAALGYGAAGAGGVIPPNATLVFEVELLKVK